MKILTKQSTFRKKLLVRVGGITLEYNTEITRLWNVFVPAVLDPKLRYNDFYFGIEEHGYPVKIT
jgi:hypothetical protein